jgi:SdrD B-like protein/IPT/TIG domain-containing protein
MPKAEAAVTNLVKLQVASARTAGGHTAGEAITAYKFLITKQDSGNPKQPRLPGCMPNGTNSATDYPKTCDWPSVRKMTGGAGGAENLVAQGDQTDLNDTTGLNLPDGDYLISVTADTFKIDGKHFTVPLEAPGLVSVLMQPDPLPLSTLKIQVFEDSMTNGQYDPQSETGLAGFTGHIEDVLGEVTTDWFGNPLCAQYDAGGNYIDGTGGECLSDANGIITIPNVGSNRYDVSVTAPDGQTWVQTTTLEGGHSWDAWTFEGWDGLDNELLINGAPIAWVQAGFVKPTTVSGGTSHVTGRVVSVKSYLPPAGGDTAEGPVSRPWIAVTDLLHNDQLVYAGQGNTDGTFDVGGLPAGDYQVAYWDFDQNLLLQLTKVVVGAGQTVNMGDLQLSHWFSEVHGTVFIDTNENGKRDAGELPLKGQPVVMKSRDNSLVDQFSRAVVTDANGNYLLKQVYPYGYWTVLEVYNDRFFTTGATYQADNQDQETTVLGAGVDIATLNQDGLNSRIDWGVKPYPTGTNGGIVGTVVYNLTRNELDARLAATEDYEPGIPNVTVKLYRPVDADGDGVYDTDASGALTKGPQIGSYLTETFERPTDCQARDAAGNALALEFAPPASGGFECVESPLMGNQIQTGFSTVNGNYGFGTVWRLNPDGTPVLDADGNPVEDSMPPGDYLVSVEVPNDALGKPKYKVTREEDVNVFDGSDFQPQVPPPPCSGALHTVDVAGVGSDGPDATNNPTFADVGGSPFEGQQKPLCDTRLVTVSDQRSIAPSFSFFTDVPQPGRLFGAVVEDLMLGTNPKEFYYGEKAGIPNAPIGVYDFTGKLVLSTQADPNGFFDILLPSTNTFNCPLPAGPCPNMYRVVGNDPGTPDHPNAGYDPQYRTMATWWQIWPGLSLLADVALLPTAAVVEQPGTVNTHPPACLQVAGTPQLFAVSQPYVNGTGSFSIEGQDFGASQGTGSVKLDGTTLSVTSWNDRTIAVTVPAGTPPGAHQLSITAGNGRSATNALTFHVLGAGYSPTVYEVGPGHTYASVQEGITAAAASPQALVVVYPNTAYTYSPLGDYFENVVMHTPIKLQGVGPGGVRADSTSAKGSILNGTGFATTRANAWSTLVESLKSGPGWSGNQAVYDGQVVYVVARDGGFTSGYKASIDGFSIEGGNEFGNEGTFVTPNYVTQGGGVFVNAYARSLQITNNVLRGNGGSFGGAIRLGTPYVGDNHNDGVRIANNRIIANGGSNLAGAIGLFNGSNGYRIDHNDICGNFSAEYGGGISHFGLSGGAGNPGEIDHNQIWQNGSYDEGAGVMIAGQDTPANSNQVSPGSGPVNIHDNLVQSNLAEDDGGGLRFLQAGTEPMNVYNNMFVNNVSAHEGGGVALDDATGVRFFNNTVMKNITTATAATSDGQPAPAGLSSGANSDLLQATLPPGSPTFSDPLLFNNVFWDNRAGSYDFQTNMLTGIGQPGDPDPPNVWDLGLLDQSGKLSPTNSILTENDPTYVNASATNKVGQDPTVVGSFDTVVRALPWRGNPQTVFSITVSIDQPPTVAGNYHLATGSPAANSGGVSKAGVNAPDHDIDDGGRPSATGFEIGADEYPGPATVPDTTGPVTSGAAVSPNPSNNSGTVTLTANATDSSTGGSIIAAAEWFTGADPGVGNGHPMTATDGTFNAMTEAVRTTSGLNTLPSGDTTIRVRAKDAAGNWGTTTSTVVHVDTLAPLTAGATVAPSIVTVGTPVTVTGTAFDSGTGNRLARAEWFEGTDPGRGRGHAMTATDGAFNEPGETFRATVPTTGMKAGTHTLRVRALDAAGNWSNVVSAVFTVRPALIFYNGFENRNLRAWSATVNPGRLPVLTAAAMRGSTWGVRAQLGGPAAYLQDNTPAAETAYTARFWFDPNSSRTAPAGHVVFDARNGAGTQLVTLEYRHPTASSPYQVRLSVRRNISATVSSAWLNVPDAPRAYEIAWRAGTSTTTTLKVGGTRIAALAANTSGRAVESARMGAITAPGVQSAGFEYFDEFYSTRGFAVGP